MFSLAQIFLGSSIVIDNLIAWNNNTAEILFEKLILLVLERQQQQRERKYRKNQPSCTNQDSVHTMNNFNLQRGEKKKKKTHLGHQDMVKFKFCWFLQIRRPTRSRNDYERFIQTMFNHHHRC